jgi:hypothetical protein
VVLVLFASDGKSVLPNFSKEQLIDNSESVVYGRVISQNSYWSGDKRGIFTDIKLSVHTQFKGEPLDNDITIQIPGGTVGEITQVVSDTPTFQPGSNVILHLFTKENGRQWIYGWEKGVLEVKDDFIEKYQMTTSQFGSLVKSLNN